MAKAIDLLRMPRVEVTKFIKSFDNFLVDCDGVIWTEGIPILGVSDVLNRLHDMNKRVIYVTNNCVLTREEFISKAKQMNFTVKDNNLICASYLTAHYLKNAGFNKKVYVLGSPGLVKELEAVNIQCTEEEEDVLHESILFYNQLTKLDITVGAVVLGMDYKFNFSKLLKASSYIQRRNCMFIVTSPDERNPNAGGLIMPAVGSLARAIESCTGVYGQVMGKPSQIMIEYLRTEYKIDPKRTVIVGDNYKTDILLGKRGSYTTLLVLTGVTKKDELDKLEPDFVPDFYLDSLASLNQFLQE